MAKEQNFPLVFASAYSQQTGDGFAVAASDIIPLSRLLRSCATLWLANHQWLMRARLLAARGNAPPARTNRRQSAAASAATAAELRAAAVASTVTVPSTDEGRR